MPQIKQHTPSESHPWKMHTRSNVMGPTGLDLLCKAFQAGVTGDPGLLLASPSKVSEEPVKPILSMLTLKQGSVPELRFTPQRSLDRLPGFPALWINLHFCFWAPTTLHVF